MKANQKCDVSLDITRNERKQVQFATAKANWSDNQSRVAFQITVNAHPDGNPHTDLDFLSSAAIGLNDILKRTGLVTEEITTAIANALAKAATVSHVVSIAAFRAGA